MLESSALYSGRSLILIAMRELLQEIQRRKDEKEDPCDSCDGRGLTSRNRVCVDCLGQGILLTAVEYEGILLLAGRKAGGIADDDAILDLDYFDSI